MEIPSRQVQLSLLYASDGGGDILSPWVGGGRDLQTPRDLTNTHKDGRSNTDVG